MPYADEEVLCERCGEGRPRYEVCPRCGVFEDVEEDTREWHGRVSERPEGEREGRLPGVPRRERPPGWAMVVYFERWELYPRDRAFLASLFGVSLESLRGLPFETATYSGAELVRLARACPGSHHLIWEKSELTEMDERTARALADAEMFGSDEDRAAQLREATVWGYDLDRCWAFLYYYGPGIPPGEGALVDKRSERVFGRRWIELEPALAALGYATPRALYD